MKKEDVDTKFGELRELARLTRIPEMREHGRDRLIRFLDRYTTTKVSQSIVDSLCVHFGLYPYLSPQRSRLSTAEAIAYEFHRPAVDLHDDQFVFHADQAAIFYRLLDGESVVLSAPTSFGKSAILDALVAADSWDNIVVIVPTVALIDEVRRRLVRFSDRYNLVTHPTQDPETRNIYVLTQERFLELPEAPRVDLFMIDEFYKLSARDGGDEQRMSMLNIAWNRLRTTGAQYYLTGPNVDTLADALDPKLRGSLVVSKFKTVAVDLEDRSHVSDDDRISDMASYWADLDGSTLVFVSAPPRAEKTAVEISDFGGQIGPTEFAIQVAAWISVNFHPSWRIVEALRGGVGTHTGPMPRSLQRIMIRLFSSGDISTLVCTSTLIEGVNTSAKNVIVYDKKINRKPIDFFTFNNVRGRAGRMARHYLGRVISYMPAPKAAPMEIDIPIDSQPVDVPLSSIIQLTDEELNRSSRSRLREVFSQPHLSLETIRENRGFDPELQVNAARKLRENRELRRDLNWSGYPNATEARAVLEFGFENLLSPNQRPGMTVKRMLGMVSAVRDAQGDLQRLVKSQTRYKFASEELSDVVTRLLGFQRNWMGFTIPSLLRATQKIYSEVAISFGESRGNYELYIAQIESLFLDRGLLDLDEYGLPLPIAMRLSEMGMSGGKDIAATLRMFVRLAQREDIRVHFSLVELWIIDDVLSGLDTSR